jgi:hypothetical protein
MAGLDLGTVEGLQNVAIPLPSAGGVNKDGLQEAHIFGTTFWSDDLGSLLDIIDPNRNLLNYGDVVDGARIRHLMCQDGSV